MNEIANKIEEIEVNLGVIADTLQIVEEQIENEIMGIAKNSSITGRAQMITSLLYLANDRLSRLQSAQLDIVSMLRALPQKGEHTV